MTSSTTTDLVPNHHAHFPGFGGFGGLVAAVGFLVGRDDDADLAVRLTGLGPSDDVVDIGCGPGVAARRAAAAGASSVVGLDPAPVMLRVARLAGLVDRRGRATPRYRVGAAEQLPCPDASASVVWSLSTVHHWPELDDGLAEVRRVLRPGGRFLAIEHQSPPGATGIASHGWTTEQAERFGAHLEDAGFIDVRVEVHQQGRRPPVSVLAVRP
jgi:ubiquinone/menaquinone biosynthesis C-methylase UbiE